MGWRIVAMVAFPCLGGVLAGFSLGISGWVIVAMTEHAADAHWFSKVSNDTLIEAMITSTAMATSIIGALLALELAPVLGRRRSLACSAGLEIVGASIMVACGLWATWDTPVGFALYLTGFGVFGMGPGVAFVHIQPYLGEARVG